MAIKTFEAFDFQPTGEQINEIYLSGFVGAIPTDRMTHLRQTAMVPDFYSMFPTARGASKDVEVCLPIRALQSAFGHDFVASTLEDQEQGDCVGKMLRLMAMLEAFLDHSFGETEWEYDEAGKPRWYCDENHYGDRGHTGEGQNCDQAWNNAMLGKRQGFIFRGKYGKYDLTKYNSRLSASWGARGTPEEVSSAAKKNPALISLRPRTVEEAEDALALGFAVGRCGSDGYSSKRDQYGIAAQQGIWQHAFTHTGFVRTKAYLDRCNGVHLSAHNWAEWNSGPKPFEIPAGSWFTERRHLEGHIKRGTVRILCSIPGKDRAMNKAEFIHERKKQLVKESYLCLNTITRTATETVSYPSV